MMAISFGLRISDKDVLCMMAISFGLRISDKDVAIFSANIHGLAKLRILCSSFVVTLKAISRYHLNGT